MKIKITPSYLALGIWLGVAPTVMYGGKLNGSVFLSGFPNPKQIGLINTVDKTFLFARSNKFFSFEVPENKHYNIRVASKPPETSCVVRNGKGVMRKKARAIKVICARNKYKVGGVIKGLAGDKIVLKLNDQRPRVFSKSGNFSFPKELYTLTSYKISLLQKPAGLTCTLAGDRGLVGRKDVKSVRIACSKKVFPLNVQIMGLAANGLQLALNGGAPVNISPSTTNFTFPTPIAYNGSFDIQVVNNPIGQTCTPQDNTGNFVIAAPRNAKIVCSNMSFSLQGDVVAYGLEAENIVLKNGNNYHFIDKVDEGLPNKKHFQFSTPLAYNGAYDVSIASQPLGSTCTVSNGKGNATADVMNVDITCNVKTYTLGGTVTGLTANTGLSLANGGETIDISAPGTFQFPTRIAHSSPYDVDIAQQPLVENCTISNDQGIATQDINSVNVSCTPSNLVRCWGSNFAGQVGDGTEISPRTKAVTALGATEVKSLSRGYAHTCALLNSGAVKCWGYNYAGAIGDGTNTDAPTPTLVALPAGAKVTQLVTRYQNTCALLDTGRVMCWGYNGDGQVGNGTIVNQSTPVEVLTNYDAANPTNNVALSDVSKLFANNYSTCALLNTGGVKCWGWNGSGQIGNNSTSSNIRVASTVVTDTAGTPLTGVADLSVNYNHVCARLNSGGVKCWGANGNGQLGNGSTVSSRFAVDVTGLSSVSKIVTSLNHTCALMSSGEVKCWGYNFYGQLGNGTNGSNTNSSVPVNVKLNATDDLAGVTQISSKYDSTCALLSSGKVKCWGYNAYGQLGNNTTTNSNLPVDVVVNTTGDLLTNVKELQANYYGACALLNSGTMKCWGYNSLGQIGDGTTTQKSVATDVIGINNAPLANIKSLSSQDIYYSYHNCVLLETEH